jgi:hypothetical protein
VKKHKKSIKITLLLITLLSAIALFYRTYSCIPAPMQKPTMGTHGWEVWSGPSFLSFYQNGARFCVPKDWQPVGEKLLERGGATFPEAATGVLVETAGFKTVAVPLQKNDFALTALYPATMSDEDRDAYVAIAAKAFDAIGSLYPSLENVPPQKHTVFITIGIAGDGTSVESSVYPTPSAFLSVFVRNKEHVRGEELFIHAATHAYNRFSSEFHTYQTNQSPLSPSDWEEMEATWSEVAFRDSKPDLIKRVADLYTVYTAVMNNAYSNALLFPFNDSRTFVSVKRKTVIVPSDATHGESEFGHYTLAPLVLLATEGLLAEKGSKATINSLLLEVHTTNKNFFELLKNHLTEEEVARILRFTTGEELIPKDLLDKGLERH